MPRRKEYAAKRSWIQFAMLLRSAPLVLADRVAEFHNYFRPVMKKKAMSHAPGSTRKVNETNCSARKPECPLYDFRQLTEDEP